MTKATFTKKLLRAFKLPGIRLTRCSQILVCPAAVHKRADVYV